MSYATQKTNGHGNLRDSDDYEAFFNYIDLDKKIIYELKPMNRRGVRSGIRQLLKYNEAYGGGFKLVLDLY